MNPGNLCRNLHRAWFWYWVGGALLIFLLLLWGRGRTPEPGVADVPRFETARWGQMGWISMRLEEPASNVILLKHSSSEAIYRYDPRNGSFSNPEGEPWDGSVAPIVDCLQQASITRYPAVIGPPGWDLVVQERRVTTAGKTALSLRVAPSRNRAAVLSAAGERRSPLIPFWGAPKGASGQHYHEVFTHPDYRRRTKAVRIPVGSSEEIVEGCWSPGERFVVYSDQQFRFICFVPAEETFN